jgi:ribonuclease P protein component
LSIYLFYAEENLSTLKGEEKENPRVFCPNGYSRWTECPPPPAPKRKEAINGLDAVKRETYRKREVLRKRKEIIRVRREGKVIQNDFFIINYLPGEKKVCFAVNGEIRKATERNLLKRRMREVYRRNKETFPNGFSYFIRVKATAQNLPFATFQENLLSLIQRCQS